MNISKKAKHVVIGIIMSTSVIAGIPAFAGPDHQLRREFNNFVNNTFANFRGAVFEQVNNMYSNMRDVFHAQMEAMYEIAEFENTINSVITTNANQLMTQTFSVIQANEVGAAIARTGLDLQTLSNRGPGKTPVTTTQNQINSAANNTNIKNPLDAITFQTVTMLQNQAQDRLNVLSFLDSKPSSANCISLPNNPEKCTILISLREKEAIAFNDIYLRSLAPVLSQSQNKTDELLAQVYKEAGVTNNTGAREETRRVLTYLTMPNSTIGFDRNAASAPDTNRANTIASVITGSKNQLDIMARSVLGQNENFAQKQLDAFSKIAKVQLARSVMLNAHSDAMHTALNAQFRACVGRPDIVDQVGASEEQHLVNIQALLRCNNLMLLQQRQQEAENQRIQASILLTLLDIYAVQAPGSVQ